MTMLSPETRQSSAFDRTFRLALPPADLSYAQDEEWCVVRLDDGWESIRFHDYDRLFSVPGLYEYLIYDTLRCDSPATVSRLLAEALDADGDRADRLRVLDLGAGNGMVGEELAAIGVKTLVGVDIIESAAEATERDRPGLYTNYHVVDMTCLNPAQQRELESYRFNCLTCVAALGFGDIPTRAFAAAYNLIASDGWVAFNIKEDFLTDGDDSGFARMIRRMIADGTVQIAARHRYRHRFGTNREPLYYVAMVARKRRNIDPDRLD